MRELTKDEMKKIKGGITPCLSECYGACTAAGGGAQAVLACKQYCREVVCVEE